MNGYACIEDWKQELPKQSITCETQDHHGESVAEKDDNHHLQTTRN